MHKPIDACTTGSSCPYNAYSLSLLLPHASPQQSNWVPTCSHAELCCVLLLKRCPEALVLVHAATQGVNKVNVLPSHQQTQVPAPGSTLLADAAAAAGPARHPQLGLQALGDSKGMARTNNLQQPQEQQWRQ